jgi:high-affinity iron transporter
MAGAALIVFRETLEAALIVAIVMSATRGIVGRGRWVSAGIGLGVLGAMVVALFAGAISDAVEGRGQELLNAGVLLAAVAMLAWHNLWMSVHGRAIVARMRTVGHDVSTGTRPLSALAGVALLAVLREGSETVLFVYGLVSSGSGPVALAAGSLLGLAGGALVGWLLYRGLLAIPVGRFLDVVAWLVLLLAAGLAANAAGFLNQAGLVPAFGMRLWDSSHIIDQRSWIGTLLHILVGYNDRPMGIQLVFYLTVLIAIGGAMRLVSRPAMAAGRAP